MKIAIGNDHAGTTYKKAIAKHLKEQGIEVLNYGTDTENSVDYPDFIHPVAQAVEENKVDLGVILCGSGNGAAMTANKHQNIRCALSWVPEIAALARQHNDANIISLPARFISLSQAVKMVDIFLHTEFEGGRHQKRVDKVKTTV